MEYVLEPLNEGQEMNARVNLKGKLAVILAKAANIAQGIQTQLAGCTISCRVRRKSKIACLYADENGPSYTVHPDGTIIDDKTGLTPKNL